MSLYGVRDIGDGRSTDPGAYDLSCLCYRHIAQLLTCSLTSPSRTSSASPSQTPTTTSLPKSDTVTLGCREKMFSVNESHRTLHYAVGFSQSLYLFLSKLHSHKYKDKTSRTRDFALPLTSCGSFRPHWSLYYQEYGLKGIFCN